MRRYSRPFDAKRYWANKPYCVVCKKHKVKDGKICRECEKEGGFDEKLMNVDAGTLHEKDLVATFTTAEVERNIAPQQVTALVGYLKDCAQAIMRSVAMTDIGSNDITFLPLPPDSLNKLAEGGIEIASKDALNILYKVASRPTEFEIIIGTLFVKGFKGNGNRNVIVNAPLLFLKLDAEKTQNDTVIFSLKEDDTIHLNQSLIASIVNVENEEELEVRFQDLYSAIPEWPITMDVAKKFLSSLTNYFPEVFEQDLDIKDFISFDDVRPQHDRYQICPSHCIIVAPRPEAEGTVVEELNKILLETKDQTALDYILLEDRLGNDPASNVTDHTSDGFSEDSEDDEEWHNLFPFDLSDTQKKIVLNARKNRLTVVSGPPGTGKSYTIAAIILDHLLGGRRVLFASRMDKAVDVVTSWLEEFIGPFAVARSGARKAQRNLADKLETITGPHSPVQPYNKDQIQKHLEKYDIAQDKLVELEKNFTEVLSRERTWADVKEKLDEINKQINNSGLAKLPINKNKAIKIKEKIRGADFLIKNKKFFVQTWWGNVTLKNIRKRLGAPETATAEELVLMAEAIENERFREEVASEINKFDEVNKLWSDIQDIKKQLREIALNNLKARLLGNLHLIVHNHQKRVEIKNFIKSLRTANIREKIALLGKVKSETLLAAFPCWASTTYHLSQILPVLPGMFDLVVFDEASQCDLASAIPALYRANRVLVVGDPKQLNHVVFLGRQAEYSSFAKNNVPPELQANYRYSTHSLFDVAENLVPQANYFMLDEHFRSDPHIIGFSNKMFYENSIRIMTHRPKIGFEDTGRAIQMEYVEGRRTEGATNPIEIENIFRHVKEIIAQSPDDKPTTIGILSPFRDQVNAITKELPNYLSLSDVEKHKIVIGTAHSLQGDEKDIVILSLSLDPDFHHGTLNFLEKPNVFNVAITRAKKKLIVLSSVKQSDLPNGLLKEFLIHADQDQKESLPSSIFESKFEEQVARALEIAGFKVWPQFEAAGFYIDMVVGDGRNWIAIECDGPTHYDMSNGQNFYDVWRQSILERAGWKFVRISYRQWEQNSDKQIEAVKTLFNTFNI